MDMTMAYKGLILLMAVLGYAELKHVSSDPAGSGIITPAPVASFHIVFHTDEKLQDSDTDIIHIVKRDAVSSIITPAPAASFRFVIHTDEKLQDSDNDIIHIVKRDTGLDGHKTMIPAMNPRMLRARSLSSLGPEYICHGWERPLVQTDNSDYICKIWERPVLDTKDES